MNKSYLSLDKSELQESLHNAMREYETYKAKNLSLDMSRGKPGTQQLDLANTLLHLDVSEKYKDENGDLRNYGMLEGTAAARALFAEILNTEPGQVIAGGNSSLNLMFDMFTRAFTKGLPNSEMPWSKLNKVKFLCPAPGYDRHFAICEYFGIEMIAVSMDNDGPDMDEVERLAATDASIKGIWCVPVFSNPGGVVYSETTIERLANMKTAAADFLILYDNAYCLHSFTGNIPEIPDILNLCEKAGHPNRVVEFASTSKVTVAGGGISCVAANPEMISYIKKNMIIQTIGYDKINMLRHTEYLRDKAGAVALMQKHAAILKPKFALIDSILNKELGGLEIASWSEPRGGYFTCMYALPGTAKRIYELCADAGVKITEAGAPYPYGKDPQDSVLRLAPSFPPLDELEVATNLLCLCAKIAAAELLLAK